MALLQRIAGTFAAALAGLVVVAGGVWWWRSDAASRDAVLSGVGRSTAWAAAVLLLPWVTSWLIGAVGRRAESNAPGGLLVAGYTAMEVVALALLIGGLPATGLTWAAFAAAALFAATYNLFACDWIAERAA